VLVDEDREQAVHAVRIADLSMQLNDPAAAVAWYQKSETLGATDSIVLVRLAEAQLKAGHIDGARATVQRALEKDPENAAARNLSRRVQTR
jgi:predicted TPR repeat methyltransferase